MFKDLTRVGLNIFKMEAAMSVPQRPRRHRPQLELLSVKPLHHMTCKHEKFSATELLFCNLPRTKAQTLWANGHSHRMCSFVSSCWLQMEHLGSVCTFHWVRFDFVGRTLQHALHINVRTLGGTFRDHNRFHNN